MTEPVTSVHHEGLSSLPKPLSLVISAPDITTEDLAAITTVTNVSRDDATIARAGGPTPGDGLSKKRSISLDNNANDAQMMSRVDSSTTYGSLTREELIQALQSRDHRLSLLENEEAGLSKKRIKVAASVPSPCSTVTSSSSSSVVDEERGGNGPTEAAAKSKKANPAPKALDVAATTLSDEQFAAKVEHVRKLAFQAIKKQITWRPSCKNGTARFAHACMCDEATFRAFLNLGEKDKTKGGKFSVDDFQSDILRNVLMVRIRYGYLSLNGDVRVSYNKNLGEMKITGSFGV